MYYIQNASGAVVGPFSVEMLREKVISGECSLDSLVHSDAGEGEWVPLSTVLLEFPKTQAILETPLIELSQNDIESRMKSRYRNAYAVANTIATVGAIVKGIGIALGIITSLIMMTFVSRIGLVSEGVAFINGLITGTIIALIAYFISFLLSALSEILKANLDTAVHGSPLLDKGDIAEVILSVKAK